MVLFGVAYVVAVGLGLLTRSGTPRIESIWPAAGVSSLWLAWRWTERSRLAVAFVVFVLTAALEIVPGGLRPLSALVVATAYTVQPVVACAVWQRLRVSRRELGTVADLWGLLLAAVAGAALGTPLAVVASALENETFSASGAGLFLLRTTVSTFVVVAVTLCITTRTDLTRRQFVRVRWRELLACWLILVAAYWLVFGELTGLPLAFLVLPLSAWVALRFSTTGAALHVVISSGFVLTFTSLEMGTFGGSTYSLASELDLAQSFMLVVAFLTLILALHRDERATLVERIDSAHREAIAKTVLLDAVIANVSDAIVLLDRSGTTVLQNPAAARLFGAGDELRHPDGIPYAADEHPLARALAGEAVDDVDLLVPSVGNGGDLIVSASARPLTGLNQGVVAAFRDVTLARSAEAALAASEQRFRSAFESANVGMFMASLGRPGFGAVVQVNRAICVFLGRPAEELLGTTIEHASDPDDVASVDELLTALASGELDHLQREQRFRHADGTLLWGLLSASAIRPGGNADPYVIALVEDITARKHAEQALTRQALHDPLTGLANRTLLTDRLERALTVRVGGDVGVGVLYLDLDGFKAINDTAGHAAGDRLLVDVARRLEGCVRPGDTVSRIGGDEFVLVCVGLTEPAMLHQVAHRVLDSISFAVEVDGSVARIGASIGVALADGHDAGQLLRLADEAMYRAKRAGRNRVVVAGAGDLDTEARSARAVRLLPEVVTALERGEFEMYGQPVHNLSSGSITAVETLLRWNHPSGQVLSPAAFLDVVEGSPLMQHIGRFVLHASCRMAAAWPDTGSGAPDVHVNVSGRQLENGLLHDEVREALRLSGLPASRLVLELTETHMPMIANSVLNDLQALRAEGVRIAIDDIGTGYSSLARITELPVDLLKIDLKFTAGLGVEPACDAVVRAVISIGQALGLAVVAEGVETERQANLLRRYGCETAQGHRYSRPIGEAALLERLAQAHDGPAFATREFRKHPVSWAVAHKRDVVRD
ncbi:MAG TPA: EAL domain-containing protein [Jatrophihabitans sp.]|jgi:diguanylate cyclase (GGDEF)-like protein/PAS domain S-box-containing protein|uniref:bifunctional diguanylate cyclase/phosphodiesterase n=1 Tax=Jatrophihabitans sp. TaxID=1932789 RepID=UPI002DFAA31C|nr:EAL domain-containing protein [Jatrophihabitans sp.]